MSTSTPAAGVLAAIVGFSLRFRGVVIALACLLLAYGVFALTNSQYDVFPEFAPPQVSIQAEAPGLAPEQVELLVSQPIENAINGLPGLAALRSQSIQGLAVITATFDPRSDIYRDRQNLAERLGAVASQLPQGVAPPTLSPLTSSTSVVLAIGMTSRQRSLMELRTLADWTLKPALLAVPGVAKVAVFGGQVRELQIQVRPDALIRYDLALDDVLAAARNATGVRGAGVIDTANQRLTLQTEGQSLSAQQLAGTVLRHVAGGNVTLGDVARVVEAPELPIGAAAIEGRAGVQLVVSEQYHANTLEVTRRVEQALAGLAPALKTQQVTLHSDLFRPANFIATATGNVRNSLLIGGVLVVVVLFAFLFNVRTAVISLVAIPLSLLAAVVVMQLLGLSLNTMTMGGLAIAVGLLVDDAVIVVENIYRRLRENQHLPAPRPAFAVVFAAALEVRSAVVYATLAIALVFVPVLTMSGLSGRLFAPLGMAYLLATLASLVVAVTVTPALSLLLLGRHPLPEREAPVVRWSKGRYAAALHWVEQRQRGVLTALAALTLAALATLPFLGGGFLPELREGHFIVHMSAVPGTSLAESTRLGGRVSQALRQLPFVRTVAQRAGRAEAADDTWGTHYSELDVDLKPLDGEAAETAAGDIRRVLAQFPGANFAVKTFLTERVEETLSGFTASVAVNVYGNDLDALDAQAAQVAGLLARIPGAADVQVQSPPGTPQLAIRLRPAALQRWGLTAVPVLEAIRTAYQGDRVGQVFEGNRVFNVAVILDPTLRRSVAEVGALPIRSPAGTFVPLRELADVYESAGRYVVLHQGARRVQTITANVAGGDVTGFVAAAKQQVTKLALPPGTYVEFGGTAQAQAQSSRDLMLHSAFAGIAIVLLLSMVLPGGRSLALVLVNLPFALVGGVVAVFATGGSLSIGALVGFVTLFGITLRNSIMLLSHYEHLVNVEALRWGPEAARRGAQERLSPILMTALVTALGLLPLALGSGAPGREIEGPMALVILGGLFTSTALNLLVLPMLALRYGRFGGGMSSPDSAMRFREGIMPGNGGER
ncbi:MAG: acriflavin resistance protein [Rhodanobacter sp. SCN 67-45]|nr:MAG: acriflavin resistance protein [Rhodanobacter sp. SCN 67-45]